MNISGSSHDALCVLRTELLPQEQVRPTGSASASCQLPTLLRKSSGCALPGGSRCTHLGCGRPHGESQCSCVPALESGSGRSSWRQAGAWPLRTLRASQREQLVNVGQAGSRAANPSVFAFFSRTHSPGECNYLQKRRTSNNESAGE